MRLSFTTALLAWGANAAPAYLPPVSDALQNILKNTDKSENYNYPTDFTRDILPVYIALHRN